MLNLRPFYRRVEFWQFAIPIIFLLLWLFSFRQELGFVLGWVGDGFKFSTNPADVPGQRNMLMVAFFAGGGLVLYFFLAMFLAAQFVLPVQVWAQRSQVFRRLLSYLLGMHGPAVFVQEGHEFASAEELTSSRPGVIFVDLTSAIVLERQSFVMRAQGRRGSGAGDTRQRFFRRPRRLTMSDFEPHARAAGPGIVFTRSGEKLRGVVSLRRQFRLKTNNKAYTRDGFEIYAHVITIFTLGEPPEVIRVTYEGEPSAQNIRAINISEKPEPREINGHQVMRRIRRVVGLNPDELDQADREEVHRYASGAMSYPEPQQKPKQSVVTPYVFDERRVFNAVFGGARLLKEDRVEDWTELPIKVAIEVFHDMVSIMSYDELYRPDEPGVFPLAAEFRPRFMRTVRNMGVLAFQFIRRRDGQPITKGMELNEEELEIFPVQEFINGKILRDRGIKLVVASFPEIRPSNSLVFQQRFETWKAQWQGAASIARAPYDESVIRTYAQERALVQQEIIQSLYPKLVDSVASSQVLAHSVLQSLEGFASDQNTRSLLPAGTVDLFWTMRNWLPAPELPPGDKEGEG